MRSLVLSLCLTLLVRSVAIHNTGFLRRKAAVAGKVGLLAANIGSTEYRKKAKKLLKIEEAVGRALAASKHMQDVARRIRKFSGVENLSNEDKAELKHLLDKGIGGASGLQNSVDGVKMCATAQGTPHPCGDSLDANVLATHLKLDRKEYEDPKRKADVLKTADLPNTEPGRRTNRFNQVSSKANPIWPWNFHDFDMDVAEVDRWSNFPDEMQKLMQDRWTDLRLQEQTVPTLHRLGGLRSEVGLGGHVNVEDIIKLLKDHPADRKTFLHKILKISWSTSQSVDDEQQDLVDRSANPNSDRYRQHKTGEFSNVVRGRDPDDPAVENWITGALRNFKPIISGPSGHTLRFLNHWAWVRKQAKQANSAKMAQYPSLEEARLLMMANMMPPKNHHSYHEIMSASIGITDGDETLSYAHPGDYSDLLDSKLAGTIMDVHAVERKKDDVEPFPNPWVKTSNPKKIEIHSLADLTKMLLQYGSTRKAVHALLSIAGKTLASEALTSGKLEHYVSTGKITKSQAQIVKDEILSMYFPSPHTGSPDPALRRLK